MSLLMIVFAVIILVGIDQSVKRYARQHFSKMSKKGPFTFGLVYNPGAFKGLFKEHFIFLCTLQSLCIACIGFYLALRHKGLKGLALTLIFAGALGNLIDRLKDGHVTDFIAIRWTKNLFYNLADFMIFVGGFIYLVSEWRKR